MRLVIGGLAQGKLIYAMRKYHVREDMVWDAAFPEETDSQGKVAERSMAAGGQTETIIINHFHHWVKKQMIDSGCPEEEALLLTDKFENCIIISDEIGNGIVPVDSWERDYRERLGRILVQLAKKAEGVERVICGIGQIIK